MSEPPLLAEADLSAVPVFPLPSLVLFPGTPLPLHFFEPRYRALIGDCIASGGLRIVAAQLAPGWQADYEGRPSIHATAGLGCVRQHRRNADGTFDVLLVGEARVFVESEQPAGDSSVPYRRAKVRVQLERSGRIEQADLTAALALAQQIAQQLASQGRDFQLAATSQDSPGLLIDKLADQLIADPAARQDLLETLDVAQRAQVLIRRLATLHDDLSRRLGRTLH